MRTLHEDTCFFVCISKGSRQGGRRAALAIPKVLKEREFGVIEIEKRQK
jgi:hypothetical protein